MPGVDPELRKIMDKYGTKIEGKSGSNMMDAPSPQGVFSRDYKTFRDEALFMSNSFYERACAFADGFFKGTFKPKDEEAAKVQEAIDIAHLNVTPSSAASLGVLVTLLGIVLALLVVGINIAFDMDVQIFLALILFLGGIIALKPISRYPIHLAQRWRLQASNQMVLCILYVVMYMRHTSNLEHAIKFAGEHIGQPLSLDLRKVLWDVEMQRFSTIKDSLDYYLERWKDHNLSFVESFHLITSSLYESNNKRRLELLEKALEVMLDGTYEGMLHFAQNVKSPITTLYMLGVILPVLGMIMLPLIGTFLGVKWYHLALLYNVFLPLGVYFMGYSIMSKRPVGYSESNIYEERPEYLRMKMFTIGSGENASVMEPKPVAVFIIIVFVLIGFSPIIYHYFDLGPDMEISFMENAKLIDYRTVCPEAIGDCDDDELVEVGPLGVGAVVISLIIPLGLAFGLATYYNARSSKLMAIRDKTKKLEAEFQGALFQLGNRLGGGFPTEMVFGDVANNLKGTPTGNFFRLVDYNIRHLGLNVRDAIFHSKVGAMNFYPSSLIESSMKVLVETSQKGPEVVSKAMISISNYLDRINKVNERLKDLLAEIVGSMRAQVAFMSPIISGIVVGIGTMITSIIAGLTSAMELSGEGSSANMAPMLEMLGPGGLFPLEKIVAPFYFQMVVGIYLVEIVIILSILANGIESGVDKLNEEHTLAKNLNRSIIFYLVVALITIVAFSMLAAQVASGGMGGGV
ncbi:MAG: hypothetical protein ABIB71_07220 [Candidatus Woesearchaeota archaeon]